MGRFLLSSSAFGSEINFIVQGIVNWCGVLKCVAEREGLTTSSTPAHSEQTIVFLRPSEEHG